jgi:hypothetical protein
MPSTGSRPDSSVEEQNVGWMQLATSASVVRRAVRVAIVVGAVLVTINHGDAILRGDVSLGRVLRIFLTILVPYCVSTYSSVSALRAAEHSRARVPRPGRIDR